MRKKSKKNLKASLSKVQKSESLTSGLSDFFVFVLVPLHWLVAKTWNNFRKKSVSPKVQNPKTENKKRKKKSHKKSEVLFIKSLKVRKSESLKVRLSDFRTFLESGLSKTKSPKVRKSEIQKPKSRMKKKIIKNLKSRLSKIRKSESL